MLHSLSNHQFTSIHWLVAIAVIALEFFLVPEEFYQLWLDGLKQPLFLYFFALISVGFPLIILAAYMILTLISSFLYPPATNYFKLIYTLHALIAAFIFGVNVLAFIFWLAYFAYVIVSAL